MGGQRLYLTDEQNTAEPTETQPTRRQRVLSGNLYEGSSFLPMSEGSYKITGQMLLHVGTR
jgi:hypothetical protein